jgi:hypothetical protein
MSKLGDAIRRSQRVEAAPMGFGAARQAPKPSLLVLFLGPASSAEAAREAGADVLLVDGRTQDLKGADAKKARDAAGDATLGVWARSPGADAAKDLADNGVDFLLFDPESTPAAALLQENLGYVLALPEAPEELFLRSLDSLTLDAVFLESVPSPLTVSRQIEIGRIGGLARKPLLAQVTADASKEDLECLRGVVGVVVTGGVEVVSRVRDTVVALPPRRHRREERPVVSLPRGQAVTEDDDDDD